MMQTVKVWDLPVRLCHWGLAACVLANLAFTEEGSDLHQYVGYIAVGIIVFRVLWGFVGNQYARFSDFFPTPKRLNTHIQHLIHRQPSEHLGHNPLGAIMMLVLWSVVVALGVTGYLMGTEAFWGDELMEEIHEALANGLMGLIALHILAAVGMSFMSKTNLVRAMITGKKILPNHDSSQKE